MNWEIKQSARYEGNDRWKWAVWIEAPREELQKIESVTYTLHPSFPNPIVLVADRKNNFRLERAGWGEFEIQVEIRRKTGRPERRKHWLELRYPEATRSKGGAKPKRSVVRRSSGKQPVIFLTSAAADAEVADAIRRVLESRKITVLTSADLPLGLPFEQSLRSVAKQADASVVVLSNAASPWLAREMEMLQQHKVRILPVSVGERPQVLPTVETRPTLHIKDAGEASAAARQVANEILSRPLV